MCRVLEVSRSGYYKWKKGFPNRRHQRHEAVKTSVIETYYQFKRRYGAPRITRELNERGIFCSLNFVASLLREAELKAKNGKGFKYSKSNSGHYNVTRNLLKRDFTATRPNEKWVTDITHILIKGGWVYLSAFMDLYSRAIVGWAIDGQMTEALIDSALDMALSRRQVDDGLIVHSDQGVQYRTTCYQEKLRRLGCQISMSRRGDCWDNAAIESFFSRLKVELIFTEKFTTLEHIRSELFYYIEIFYNRQRRHSANGYISPMQFESKFG
jgi:putative transposase